ncbi:Cadmium, cobalt and zinc/H(+)-K(+) antiporter [Polystyrenella longa]|uniref:Cadmium, cobalt and zinc/H(+)-K(+) antiporter n=1 Tax=Polystyrenella longa TaxID=2528007 RepID=A0A518CP06_9PLAN|nr:cation diffusion facilitator family transporter [Polystyrenella longa]QDU80960.1 Cadmium, cobalt and zinc/H(+)-K(+) antiporter [Polystyrenella longa]
MSHHHHDHGHSHSQNYNRSFALGVILNLIYIVVEAVYGILSGSLALLADAGHNLSDVLGLLLAWAAYYLSNLKPTERHTYGWGASTILAALLNALILIAALGGICWEAISRFGTEQTLPGMTIIVVAAIGVVINTATALLFMKNQHDDLNIRGAFLHMAADAAVSVGVVLGGVAIYFWQTTWIDPALSLLIAVVIFISTWGLLKDSLNLALQAVPRNIDPSKVHQSLEELDNVRHIHDLHIWALSTTETALSVHLVLEEINRNDEILAAASEMLKEKFKIVHSTIQIEHSTDYECHSETSCNH